MRTKCPLAPLGERCVVSVIHGHPVAKGVVVAVGPECMLFVDAVVYFNWAKAVTIGDYVVVEQTDIYVKEIDPDEQDD